MASRYTVIDASMDLQTARAVKVAQAIAMTELVPTTTGRRLVRCARAARLFTEAMEYRAANAAYDEMVELLPADDAEFTTAREAVMRAVERARRSIGFVADPKPVAVSAA